MNSTTQVIGNEFEVAAWSALEDRHRLCGSVTVIT